MLCTISCANTRLKQELIIWIKVVESSTGVVDAIVHLVIREELYCER